MAGERPAYGVAREETLRRLVDAEVQDQTIDVEEQVDGTGYVRRVIEHNVTTGRTLVTNFTRTDYQED